MFLICREITQRVDKGRECWAWQIQNVAFLIRNNQAATNHEVNNLLRACQMDIVDLFPADQKLLTEIVWDYVKQANINGELLELLRYQLVDFFFKYSLRNRIEREGVSRATNNNNNIF